MIGIIHIDAKPREQTRLEVTDPKGKMTASGVPFEKRGAALGTWKVVAKAAGHEMMQHEFAVVPDELTPVKLQLRPLAALKVTGGVAGTSVKVTGPKGFSNEGALPWEASGLPSGTYRVEATRDGYEAYVATVVLEPGRTSSVAVELRKKVVRVAALATSGARAGGMASIPGGTYTMRERKDTVTVAAFLLDVTGVTVAAYKACVDAGRCSAPDTGGYCNWEKGDRLQHPVNCVDWNQATAYCAWAGNKRLPTEEEREWAARGGEAGRTYPWGEEAPGSQLCWNRLSSKLGTCAVGSYPAGASVQGVQDLAGNVWEWTSSAFDSAMRVVRGGSWSYDDPRFVRAAYRFRYVPSSRDDYLGFRCARTK